MIITCPSCGRTHDSSQHRGAFEIDCDCGYSILVPDEAALASAVQNGGGFQSPPIAMDEEDDQLSVDVNDATNVQRAEVPPNPFAPFDGATAMTPESELPSGMIYDPDEADALAESKQAWSQDSAEPEAFLDPFEDGLETDGPPNPMPELELVKSSTSIASELVERNQSASLGHLVGSYFDLDLRKLSEDQLLKLAARSEELLRTSPWLRQLSVSRSSKCAPEDFVNHKKLVALPEVLALELFLYCHEIGGHCAFSPTEALETHSP